MYFYKKKTMSQPNTNTSYFERYTSLVKEENLNEAFQHQERILQDFYNKVSEEKSMYAYAEGKWTLKEMLQHMIDTERIFIYRALAIARKETATLPGFDENIYADNSEANKRTWTSLVEEMEAVRKASQLMFGSFTDTMLNNIGKFSSAEGSPNTLGFICVGHVYHHIKIAEERYF
jgi:DinB superfamily